MKKTVSVITAVVLALALFALTGCEKGNKSESKEITVGASATPHAEILEEAATALEKEGYKLNVVIYDDYVLPNKALNDGEIDANYFQHKPYLDSFNKSNNTDLVSAAAIHYEPFGIYSNGVSDLGELKKGATIIIPADDSNETRALLLLAQEKLITLPEDASAANGVTTLDIIDDGGYNVQTVQADTVAAQLKNSDPGTIAVINGNYAIQAGLKIADALATENADGDAAQTYANIIAVKKGEESSDKINALVKVLKTDEIKSFIEEKYNGAVLIID